MSAHSTSAPPTSGTDREVLRRAVHDVRNPLAVLRASLGWLETELGANPDIAADILDAVRDSSLATMQLVRITDDLTLLSLMRDPAAPARVPIVLGPIVDAAARACMVDAPRGTTVAVNARTFDEALFVATGDVVLVTRAIEASLEAVVRGAAAGSQIEVDAAVVPGGIQIAIGASDDLGPFTEHDALAGSGLAIHVASLIASAHGGALDVTAGAKAPRVVLSLTTV